ncbi:hypothetical protein [Hydrogenophaga intermedia]|uniref:hypothetical protein n=1 Tax=Hydrogenophaga intermedia TaxID=65786 RepID=UPI002043F987|nr:hypothetical protein [Hydrogenophaga intermedia]MCM3563130.1 hypothetical protein [Hydrogenophaga intermedia]
MPGLSLGELFDNVSPVMEASELELRDNMSVIAKGDEVSNTDLLMYQYQLGINSLTASIASSVCKERLDTLKAVVQKF